MARALLTLYCVDTLGNKLPTSTNVRIYEEDGETPIEQSLYAAASGGSALTQPLHPDSLGVLNVYVDRAQRATAAVGSATPVVCQFEADPSTLEPRREFTPEEFGAVGDLVLRTDAYIASGSKTVEFQYANFSAAERARLVGKTLTVAISPSTTSHTSVIVSATASTILLQDAAPATSASFVEGCFFGTDNTGPLNDLFDAVREYGTSSQRGGGATVKMLGQYGTSNVDMSRLEGVTIVGAQAGASNTALSDVHPGQTFLLGTHLVPWGDTDDHFVDFGCNRNCELQDMTIGLSLGLGSWLYKTLDTLLFVCGGTVSATDQEVTALRFSDLWIAAKCTDAVYISGPVSLCKFERCRVYQVKNGSTTVLTLSGTNRKSYTSPNYTAYSSTYHAVAEIVFEQCEFHDESTSGSASTCQNVVMDGAQKIRFTGGSMVGRNVIFGIIDGDAASNPTREILVEHMALGTTVNAPADILLVQSGSVVTNWWFHQCEFQNASATAIIGGQDGCSFKGLQVLGCRFDQTPSVTALLTLAGTTPTNRLTDCVIDAMGLTVTPNGLIMRSLIWNYNDSSAPAPGTGGTAYLFGSSGLVSPRIKTSLLDANAKTWIGQGASANAVNYPQISNAATGANPTIAGTGSDTNVGLDISGKGTGAIRVIVGTGSLQVVDSAGTNTLLIASGTALQLGSASRPTNATTGFPYAPTMAGGPSGTPTAITGMAPYVWDDTNFRLKFYSPSASAWKSAQFS